eukprot:2534985-Rhodomonas_salina.1
MPTHLPLPAAHDRHRTHDQRPSSAPPTPSFSNPLLHFLPVLCPPHFRCACRYHDLGQYWRWPSECVGRYGSTTTDISTGDRIAKA